MTCIKPVDKDVEAQDISSMFDEGDLIILKYWKVARHGEYIIVPIGYTIVACSETGDIAIYDGPGRFHIFSPCWIYLIKRGGAPCKVPVGIPCTRNNPGFSFIAYFMIQSGIFKITPEELISVLTPHRDKIIRLNCRKIKEDLVGVLQEILKRSYNGDVQKLYNDFYANRRNAAWFIDLIRDYMESIRIMARFITVNIMNLEYVSPSDCPDIGD